MIWTWIWLFNTAFIHLTMASICARNYDHTQQVPTLVLGTVVFFFCPYFSIFRLIYEQWSDKTSKMTCAPSENSISLGIFPVSSESSLYTQWVAKDPSFLHADSADSDQTGRMPRLIWVFAGRTSHFVGFIMLRSILHQHTRASAITSLPLASYWGSHAKWQSFTFRKE